jgi:hypothetical protein
VVKVLSFGFQFLAIPRFWQFIFIAQCMARPSAWFISAISGSEGVSPIAN